MQASHREYIINLALLFIVATLAVVNTQHANPMILEQPRNVELLGNGEVIILESLTIEQKIAQMLVVYDNPENARFYQDMLVGGIHMGPKENKQTFIDSVNTYQDDVKIPFLITVDLEGCLNPFENFKEFPSFADIHSVEDAEFIGREQGRFLKEMGVSMNFAPVVDLHDTIWGCRAFSGGPEVVADKANAFISGLQEVGILATAKHYPGKTLVIEDPHVKTTHAEIGEDDLIPFKAAIEHQVDAVMVSHLIVEGAVDSGGMPTVVSTPLVDGLREGYDGLIVTDEIWMLGVRGFYDNEKDLYLDVFRTDIDLILFFNTDERAIYDLISIVAKDVERGLIPKERIDSSVRRILEAKGFQVI